VYVQSPFFYDDSSSTSGRFKCWNWWLRSNQQREGQVNRALANIVEEASTLFTGDPYRVLVNRSAVYVVGLSAGGAAAYNFAATYPDVVHGAAVVVGLPYKIAECGADDAACDQVLAKIPVSLVSFSPQNSSRWAFRNMDLWTQQMRVMIMEGSLDELAPAYYANQSLDMWARANDLTDNGNADASVTNATFTSHHHALSPGVEYDWSVYCHKNATNAHIMELWVINGMTHDWPGDNLPGDPLAPDSSARIVRFLVEGKDACVVE